MDKVESVVSKDDVENLTRTARILELEREIAELNRVIERKDRYIIEIAQCRDVSFGQRDMLKEILLEVIKDMRKWND